MITLNIACSNCINKSNNQLQIRTEKDFLVVECLGCGDIMKFKDAKKQKERNGE